MIKINFLKQKQINKYYNNLLKLSNFKMMATYFDNIKILMLKKDISQDKNQIV